MKRGGRMVHMTITVPASLKREMDRHNQINWSAVATKGFQRRIEAEKILEKFAETGISEEEAIHRGLRIEGRLSQRVRQE